MQRVLADVEKVSKRLKRFSKDVSEIARPFLFAAVGFIAAAAKTNRAMKAQMDRLTGLFLTAASEIGMAFLPIVKELADSLSRLVSWFQRLSPETKRHIADWIALAAKVAIGAMVFAKVAAGVAALAEGLSIVVAGIGGFLALLSGVLVPLLAVAAGVAGVILLVGALKKAWSADFLYIQEVVKYFWEYNIGAAKDFFGVLDFVLKNAKAIFVEYIRSVLQGWEALASMIPGVGDKIAAGLAKLDAYVAIGSEIISPQVVSDLEKLGTRVAGVAKDIGGAIKDGIFDSLQEGLKALGLDALLGKLGEIKAKLIGMFSGGSGKVNIAQSLEKQDAAFEKLKNKILQSLGDLGDLYQSAAEGFDTGGIWGAIAAVGTDLLSRSETFKTFIGRVSAVVGVLADVLGALAGPILRPLFEVLKVFAQAIVKLVSIIDHVYNVIAELSFGKLQKIDTSGVDAAYEELNKITWDQVDATSAATDAMNGLTDSLLNAPEGFKVAAARFNAMDAVAAPSPAPVSGGTQAPTAPSGGTVIHINGITDPDAVAAAVQKVLDAQEARRTSRSFFGTSRFAQEF